MATIQQEQPERLNLDEIEARINADREVEREQAHAQLAIYQQPEQSADTRLVELQEENERMRKMILSALDARNSARNFMAIWSDPRRFPDLVQEIYTTHPGIALIKKDINEETAQRAARTVGHLAVTYQINPFISGMIYAWSDKGVGIVEIGYKGYEELIKRDEYRDLDGPREMTPEERELHGLGPDDRGAVCYLFDWKRIERFKSQGLPAPKPYEGVAVWRAGNSIPKGRTNQWVANKNSLKDLARHAVSFSIVKTAEVDVVDLTYDEEMGIWRVPASVADWTTNQGAVGRFTVLLKEHGIEDETFNAFLGHNWLYTQLSPTDLKAKFDEFLAKQTAIEGTFTEPAPTDPAAPAITPPQSVTVVDTPQNSAPDAPQTAQDGPNLGDGDKAVVEDPKGETAALVTTEAAPVKVCANCGCEPATDNPINPAWCDTCANRKANQTAH